MMTRIDEHGTGLGLVEAEDGGGRRWLGHSGSYAGFESELWHDGSRGLTINNA
ncbi:MAG TPA: hypothetical protein VM841_06870 [Actinomycetota bacterium]|nr:hypothetical protein [Actinomycetota bacterium]